MSEIPDDIEKTAKRLVLNRALADMGGRGEEPTWKLVARAMFTERKRCMREAMSPSNSTPLDIANAILSGKTSTALDVSHEHG